MPKLRQPPADIATRHLLATIAQRCEFLGITNAQLAKAAGITVDTMRARRRKPELFTYRELLGIAAKLGFTAPEVCNMLGVKYEPVVIAGEQYIVK